MGLTLVEIAEFWGGACLFVLFYKLISSCQKKRLAFWAREMFILAGIREATMKVSEWMFVI